MRTDQVISPLSLASVRRSEVQPKCQLTGSIPGIFRRLNRRHFAKRSRCGDIDCRLDLKMEQLVRTRKLIL